MLDRSTPVPTAPATAEPAFAMSIDVEDYFQVQAFASQVSRAEWERWPCRVEANVERLLALLDDTGAHATFFTLGWVAERYPNLVRRIAECGHEVASHGMSHRMLTELSPEEMRAEARDSRCLLEDVSGSRVEGYRAPSYTINRDNHGAALGALVEAGYTYDSSMFPIRGRRYGYPEGPVLPTRVPVGAATIAEFPMSTVAVGPLRIPVLAGSYLRLMPAWFSIAAVRHHLARNLPLVVNIHPWEADPGQPTIGPSRRRAWSHYARLGSTSRTLERVLRIARFGTVRDRLRDLGLLEPAGTNGSPR